jgi:hypothetical protein
MQNPDYSLTKIYNEINGSQKLLMSKVEGLQKHIMKWKCETCML